jgi:hypothetical protein
MGKKGRKKKRESNKSRIDLHLFQIPNPLQNAPDEVREKIAKEMGLKFREELATCLRRTEELITKLDPLYTLSHFAFYDLTLAAQSSEAGKFKETPKQPDIELLQALFLTLPKDQVAFGETPIPPIQELRMNSAKTGFAFAMQRVGDKPSDSSVMVNEGMRMHTQGIRNWGYPDEITTEAMRNLLNLWSLSPGDLQHENKDHFFLNNPIWRRPIIKLRDDTYFWPLLQLFVAFGLEMIESVVAQFPEVLKKYQDKTRPKYLEDQAEALFRTALPKCNTFKGSMWKEYENDLLVLIDKTAIIVECKSGRVDPSARRGGQRLEQVVKELILEPSVQGARFADFLLNNRGPHVFKTKRGVENRCDTTKLLRVIRLRLQAYNKGRTRRHCP